MHPVLALSYLAVAPVLSPDLALAPPVTRIVPFARMETLAACLAFPPPGAGATPVDPAIHRAAPPVRSPETVPVEGR